MVQKKLSINKIIKKKNSKNNIRFFFEEKVNFEYSTDDKFQSIDFPDENDEKKLLRGGLRYKGLFKNSIEN